MNVNGNLISALRNMVEDIEKLGAGPLTVDVTVLKQALSSLQIAQRTSALVDEQNLLLKSYESTMGRMDEFLTKPPEGYVLAPEQLPVEMEIAFMEAWVTKRRCIDDPQMQDAWSAALAERPKVSP